jgi:hypothetical protein
MRRKVASTVMLLVMEVLLCLNRLAVGKKCRLIMFLLVVWRRHNSRSQITQELFPDISAQVSCGRRGFLERAAFSLITHIRRSFPDVSAQVT